MPRESQSQCRSTPSSALQAGVSHGLNTPRSLANSANQRKLMLVLGPGFWTEWDWDNGTIASLRQAMRSSPYVTAIVGDGYRDITLGEIASARRELDRAVDGPTTAIVVTHGTFPPTRDDVKALSAAKETSSTHHQTDIAMLTCEAGPTMDYKDMLPQGSQMFSLVPDDAAWDSAVIKPDSRELEFTLIQGLLSRLTDSIRRVTATDHTREERDTLMSAHHLWEEYLLRSHHGMWCPPLVTSGSPNTDHTKVMRDQQTLGWGGSTASLVHDLFDPRLEAETVAKHLERISWLPSAFDPVEDAYGPAVVFAAALAEARAASTTASAAPELTAPAPIGGV